MYRKLFQICVATVCLGFLSVSVAQADTLDEITKRGELICGVVATVEPFGFPDKETRKTVGYNVDICEMIAGEMGVKASIKVIPTAARMAELNEKHVDILVAQLSYTPERAQVLDYSLRYYSTPCKIVVGEDTGIKGLEDLERGGNIGLTRGSSNAAVLKGLFPKLTITTFTESPLAFLALEQGKIDGYAASELVLRKFVMERKGTKPLLVLEKPFVQDEWGVGVRKDDPRLLTAVNNALKTIESNGKLDASFDKWLGKDSPYKLVRQFTVGPITQ